VFLVLTLLGAVGVGGVLGIYTLVKLHTKTAITLQIVVIVVIVLCVLCGHWFVEMCVYVDIASKEFRRICLETRGLTKYFRLVFQTCFPVEFRIPYICIITRKFFLVYITQVIVSNAITCILAF